MYVYTLFDQFEEGIIWFRGSEILIKKLFQLTHKENIKKTREAVTSSLDTVKLCGSKYYIERL